MMSNDLALNASFAMLNSPFSLMTGSEVAVNLVQGEVAQFVPEATYLVDRRDGLVMAEYREDESGSPWLEMLNTQGRDRWAEFASV